MPQTCVPDFVGALSSEHAEVRAWVVVLLAETEIGDPTSLAVVKRLAVDDADDVRYVAKQDGCLRIAISHRPLEARRIETAETEEADACANGYPSTP